MKLRLKIFLLVGCLFFGGFLLSFFLEEAETRREIVNAQRSLKQELVTNFFREDLDQFNTHSATLLKRIQESGCEKITEMMDDEYWVNLLFDSSKMQAPVSLVVIDSKDLFGVTQVPFSDNGSLFIIQKGAISQLCVGLALKDQSFVIFPIENFVRDAWTVLPTQYRKKAEMLKNELVQSKEVSKLLENFSYQKAWINQHKSKNVRFKEHKKTQIEAINAFETLLYCYPQINTRTMGVVQMISNNQGIAMFNYDPSSTKPLLEDETVAPKTGDGFSMFTMPRKTQKLSQNQLVSININCFLEKLSLISNETVLFVYDKEILLGYDVRGVAINDLSHYQELVPGKQEQIIKDKEGNEYFIWKMDLFNTKGLEVIVVSEVHKGGIFDSVDGSFHKLLEGFSLQLFIVFFSVFILFSIILNFIIGRITKPIAILARSATSVSEGGSVTTVTLPERKVKFKDEIDTLYDTIKHMFKVLKDKDQLRSIFDKMVSPVVAERLIAHGIELGGEEKEAVMLIADIRGFTEMTEHMDPHEMVSMLNQCMTEIKVIINQFEGIVDKYVGDEVMVLFNVPEKVENPELKACQCAEKMLSALNVLNISRKIANKPEIHMGIGIHSGKVIAGNMGAEDRLNYTVIGSAVNLTSRLCDHASADEILISEHVFQQVSTQINAKEKEEITFKGFTQPVKVYAIEKN